MVAPILSDLPSATSPEHKKELSQVLGFMLNIPHASDAFVFCANEVRVARPWLLRQTSPAPPPPPHLVHRFRPQWRAGRHFMSCREEQI